MKTARLTLALALISGFLASPSAAATHTGLKGLAVELTNPRPAFLVRVEVDRKDRTYGFGATATVTVTSERKGYLYLVYFQADESAVLLYPNVAQRDNRIVAKKPLTVPARNAGFRLRVQPPAGQEILLAIVASRPLKSVELDEVQFGKRFLPVTAKGMRGMKVELDTPPAPGKPNRADKLEWAEHHVVIQVRDPKVRRQAAAPRRIGVVVAVGDYRDRRIPQLKSCHADSPEMAGLLRSELHCDRVLVLTGTKATRKAIEHLLRRELPALTRPGDEIILYWTGHGTRIADDNRDETVDHMDEVLVPYDADLTNVETTRQTCIVDDEFGRWIQAVDGRRCLIILDCCYAGGHASDEGRRRIRSAAKAGERKPFDFLDVELGRMKDIGQKNVALLGSSSVNQISWVSRGGKLSIMTEHFSKRVKSTRGLLSLTHLFQSLKRSVPPAVQRQFPGYTQTPVLIGRIHPEFYLRRDRRPAPTVTKRRGNESNRK